MPEISRRLVAVAVATRLVGVTNATGYVGKVSALSGLPGVTGTPDSPPVKSASDARVKPYFVLFPGAGTPGPETDLGDSVVDLDLPFQLTVAGGDLYDVLALADRVHAALHRWAPVVDGHQCGPLRVPPGYAPGVVLTDRDFTPHRLYTPLQYQLTAHT
ncbi:hypothetical protein NPS01_25500 [Nocardioides psychrotolerans]|uniref:Tail terminator n=1 Tax=Nocardioides psychrotolerans TaxID=1005945 RepID=A0A1I3LQC3_9ACTN|nr:hypothetical protein [Nocardioides psychrotolerans]GEP38887.1 hypothetical protein NPS01_25500 [Nocardioides psychrotolerans]SFI86892.1 hypothetical protein SAMN05216561_11455 [Nocardioides psychrotolerans]